MRRTEASKSARKISIPLTAVFNGVRSSWLPSDAAAGRQKEVVGGGRGVRERGVRERYMWASHWGHTSDGKRKGKKGGVPSQ
jgi:hypothetical protein